MVKTKKKVFDYVIIDRNVILMIYDTNIDVQYFYQCPNIVHLLISDTDINRCQVIPTNEAVELTHYG